MSEAMQVDFGREHIKSKPMGKTPFQLRESSQPQVCLHPRWYWEDVLDVHVLFFAFLGLGLRLWPNCAG